jgi:hypothetical protein
VTKRRRRIIITAIVVVPLFALFLIWAFVDAPAPDDADLRIAYEAIRPRGESAFTYLERAVAALDWPTDYDEKKRLDGLLLDDGWDDALAADIVARNESILAMLDQALACPRFQVPEFACGDTWFPYLTSWRMIGRLAAIRAEILFREGREKEAFDQALQAVCFGDRVQGSHGATIHWMVGSALKETGLRQIRRMLCRTQLGAEALDAFIGQLKACDALETGLGRSLQVEYMCTSVVVDSMAPGGTLEETFGHEFALWVRLSPFKPNKTKAALAASIRVLIANARKTYVAAESIPLPPPDSTSFVLRAIASGNGKGAVLYQTFMPPLARLNHMKCMQKSSLAATQVLIALRCYQLEHGELSETLDALVPSYLDAVPLDDFDGKPMKYSKAKRVVYAVGPDLTDNGGVAQDDREGTMPDPGFDFVYKIGF